MQKLPTADLLEPPQDSAALGFLSGGGEMGERIRSFDWATTPVGPMKSWSPALRTMLGIMLANRFPHILWWGPQYIQFYNDAYRPVPGTKHPERVLGKPGSECWAEIWHVIGPLVDRPFNGGPATWDDDILLEVCRRGFVEETHFTIAYSPVPDETAPNGIGGVLATVHEITEKVIAERRVGVLRDLGAKVGVAKTAEEACALAAKILEKHAKDVPFALLYLLDGGARARLAGAAGVSAGEVVSPLVVDLGNPQEDRWHLADALEIGDMQVVEELATHFAFIPSGPWSDLPNTGVVVSIPSNNPRESAGLMVVGLSARLKLDRAYRDFLELMKTQIATAIANARAYEEERKRAEALAELDRAKTAFFSNISHEFRTPLTLMLGPVEDLLAKSQIGLSPVAKAQLELVNRNGLRLLRLVNTLLDFSRIEAGRVQAVFEPTDLAGFTSELASLFRSATERAGLNLIVACPSLPEPVYVDRDMWEKVVLNLISNAFKFTFEGEIEVGLRAAGAAAELRVRDTGVGISAAEMPRLFERFHRVHNTRSRTHEGSGIGLALVQELLKLHGGNVRAESEVGRGTTFIVTVPLGNEHLPRERIGTDRNLASTAVGGAPFVEEALRWLPNDTPAIEALPPPEPLPVHCPPGQMGKGLPRLIIADDNVDLRQYVARLLAERYEVQVVGDGVAALAAARERRPDLVLSDVMMPNLDGFGLVRELRADPALRTIPIILLSARAGEESRVEGLVHGADDYLIKPFSARELLARVAAHLDMARLRMEFQAELERLVAARTKSLEETTNQLNTFCYAIAHDLKAPIRTQVAFANLLLEKFGSRIGTEGVEYLTRMREAAERQGRLVTDLLSYMSFNRTELPLEPIELAGALEAACSDLHSEFQASRAVLQSRGVTGLVLANGASLHLVLSNLLSNAIKFVAPETQPQIFLWTELRTEGSDSAFVRLWVKDNGIGIPARSQEKIFGVFQRLHPRERYPGTGIGLAIVKRALERMGGRVGVESQPGEGSRFWVELQASKPAQFYDKP